MKSKREVLREIVKKGHCIDIDCKECPYGPTSNCCAAKLRSIGAMAILRQNRKKRGIDPNKVLTCVTADQAKVGMKGYFADDLLSLRQEYTQKNIHTLTAIQSEGTCSRFESNNHMDWILFYPIDEFEAE